MSAADVCCCRRLLLASAAKRLLPNVCCQTSAAKRLLPNVCSCQVYQLRSGGHSYFIPSISILFHLICSIIQLLSSVDLTTDHIEKLQTSNSRKTDCEDTNFQQLADFKRHFCEEIQGLASTVSAFGSGQEQLTQTITKSLGNACLPVRCSTVSLTLTQPATIEL